MGKIASSDLHLTSNFIFGNCGQLGRFILQLTVSKMFSYMTDIRVYFPQYSLPLVWVGIEPLTLFDSPGR